MQLILLPTWSALHHMALAVFGRYVFAAMCQEGMLKLFIPQDHTQWNQDTKAGLRKVARAHMDAFQVIYSRELL